MSARWKRMWIIAILIVVTEVSSPLPTAVLASRAAYPTSKGGCIGVERWDVKTLSDPAASRVSMTPVTTTVENLRALNIPGKIGLHTPRYSAEEKTYTVTAMLLEAAREPRDHDYHLVIAGARLDTTMIAEIPDPACLTSQSRIVTSAIKKARSYFDQTFGQPSDAPAFTQIRRTVTVTGVLFFDTLHSQRGVAPNAVELHPVLSVHSP